LRRWPGACARQRPARPDAVSDAPTEVRRLADRRADARSQRDFATADRLREEIQAAGWTVTDEAGSYALTPVDTPEPGETLVDAADVGSVLDQPTTFEASVHWICEGWPEDIDRALAAFRAQMPDRRLQFVVANVTDEPAERWQEAEVLPLRPGTPWAAARNAGLRRSRGDVVLAMDGSVEPTGDVLGPLQAALDDPELGVCGPFGVVTTDLREFEPSPDPGPCDAIEGYLMAFRREILSKAGFFDEKFKWYRTADIEWCFRVKDAGYRAEVVHVPVEKHEHRMWFETPPAERAKWSKRNFYRFLDRWRDRWDLVLSGEPEHTHDHHHHDGE
jgi:Glycosyl transferase family 2